jgi:hypothetical protein
MDRQIDPRATRTADDEAMEEGETREHGSMRREMLSHLNPSDDEWPDNPGEADCFGGGATSPRRIETTPLGGGKAL